MRWLVGVLIVIGLIGIGLTWLNTNIINDNLFLIYSTCGPPGQDS